MKFTLGKEEKLKSNKTIESLFAEGKRIKSFPLQLVYLPIQHDHSFPIKIGFSVPKRNVKLAVNRNRIKRLMREVYRKNKHLFIDTSNSQFAFMLIFSAKEEKNYSNIEIALKKIIEKFLLKIKDYEQN